MRPLRLMMQAFGPYVERQEIDFTALGSRQFFLVHGPTGAGKTTIFDAICYALYGVTSGAQRDAKHMRSDYAPIDLATEVVFDFAVGRDTYRVRRMPPQEVPKKRGEGLRSHPGAAELYRIDEDGKETESLGDKYVNQKIVDIVGFEVGQFRQVVLLPQGDFRKLLLAGSDEREAILSRLFSTEVFARVTERLREKARELTETYRERNSKRENYLDAAEVDSIEALDEHRRMLEHTVGELTEKVMGARKVSAQAQEALADGRRLAERFQLQAKTRERQAALAQEKSRMDATAALLERLRHAAEMQDRYTAWQRLTETGKDISGQLQTLQAALPGQQEKAAYWAKERQELHDTAAVQERRVQELAELRRRVEQQQRLQEMQTQAKQAEQEVADATAALTQAQERRTVAEAALTEATERVQNLRTVAALTETAQQTATHMRTRRQAYDAWQKLASQSEQAHAETAAAAAALTAAQQAATEAATRYERIVFLRRQDSLASLAAGLEDDTPCPVCGSRSHPQPALAAEYVPSMEEETAALAAQQAAQDELQQRRTRLAECRVRADQLAAETERRGEEFSDVTRDKLVDAVTDAERLLHDAQTAQAELPKGEAALVQARQTAQSAIEACTAAERSCREKETAAARAAERVRALTEELSAQAGTAGDAATRLQELESRIQDYRRRREACDTRAAADEEAYRHALQRQEEWQRQLQECRDRYREEKEILTLRATDIGFPTLAAVGEALAQLDRRPVYEKEITDYRLECRRVEGDLTALTAELAEQTMPDVAVLTQAQQAAETAVAERQRELAQIQEQLKQVVRWGELYRKETEAIAELDTAHAVVGRLAALASGTDTSAAAKMTFQRYVLATILDEVLVLANVRLRDMSHHRYQLKREVHATDRRSTEGLELAVIDRWTGNVRPVNTLSGGETFLASLALALGLADTAQAYAGGLRMDMMLIDEGFGTLDGEALDEAIRVLLELRTGGRLVGIISHVDELRRRIDTRLEIKKTEHGSRAHWVLG